MFRWIIDDLKDAFEQLRKPETWIVIGLIFTFILLLYLVGRFAFRTDAILVFHHATSGYCRPLSDFAIIMLFCGMIFFFFFATLTLGELQQYFSLKERKFKNEASTALRGVMLWGGATIGMSLAALVFFNNNCT
ncbi:MAG: hypothetical protein L6Q55_05470 [Azonexus sp.]|nr:hypothetical protein [Azonexus sp.]MCK6411862.1 hypothetical protein [Azonexus sp.]